MSLNVYVLWWLFCSLERVPIISHRIMFVGFNPYLLASISHKSLPCLLVINQSLKSSVSCLSFSLVPFSRYATVYPKKYAHGFCFAVFCCGYILTDFPISIRLTSLALWQSNDCPSASKATLMNMDKYFMWIHYKRLHNHNKAKHNKTVCIFLRIYCTWILAMFGMTLC